MCGVGIVTEKACSEENKGYNISCILDLASNTPATTYQFHTGYMGGANVIGTAKRVGATSNCGAGVNDSYVCYQNIETPAFNELPVQYPASIATGVGRV